MNVSSEQIWTPDFRKVDNMAEASPVAKSETSIVRSSILVVEDMVVLLESKQNSMISEINELARGSSQCTGNNDRLVAVGRLLKIGPHMVWWSFRDAGTGRWWSDQQLGYSAYQELLGVPGRSWSLAFNYVVGVGIVLITPVATTTHEASNHQSTQDGSWYRKHFPASPL